MCVNDEMFLLWEHLFIDVDRYVWMKLRVDVSGIRVNLCIIYF